MEGWLCPAERRDLFDSRGMVWIYFKGGKTIMELVSLTCGHCGAPLEVPEGTRYATCGYCSSKLEIHRSGGAIYTEVLEALQKRTAEIADDVEILKLQNELERIDREWQAERESCLSRDKNGNVSEPSAGGGTIGMIVAIGFGIFWIVMAAGSPAPGMALVGVLVIAFAIIGFFVSLGKASMFAEKKQAFERRRATVLQAMREFENVRR
jgi:DNA-directed RNA polymerase subunit RPC12/RpoP